MVAADVALPEPDAVADVLVVPEDEPLSPHAANERARARPRAPVAPKDRRERKRMLPAFCVPPRSSTATRVWRAPARPARATQP